MNVYEYTYTRRKVAEAPATVRAPADCAALLRQTLHDGLETEHLVVIALDVKNKVIGQETVYRGNLAGSSVRVGECFRLAVRLNAAAIIVGHNHPSGDPSPSAEDTKLTTEFSQAGRVLDIIVLDHIVIGEGDSFRSLRESGAMVE